MADKPTLTAPALVGMTFNQNVLTLRVDGITADRVSPMVETMLVAIQRLHEAHEARAPKKPAKKPAKKKTQPSAGTPEQVTASEPKPKHNAVGKKKKRQAAGVTLDDAMEEIAASIERDGGTAPVLGGTPSAPPEGWDASEEFPEPTPAPAETVSVPTQVADARNFKEIVGHYMDQGYDTDRIVETLTGIKGSVPILSRVNDLRPRVERVAALCGV